MQKTVLVVSILSLLGGVRCVLAEDEIDLQKISDQLPPELADKFNISALPSEEEATKLIREKCRKESGSEDAYEKASLAKTELENCIKSIINFEELKQEMEQAKPTGDLDLVFKRYCKKVPEVKDCVFNFTATIEPCLDEQERDNKKIIQNVTDSLADFICYKEGDRIALFIAEGGPECLSLKQEEIKACVNSTMGKYAVENPSIENIPRLLLNAEQCQDIANFQTCVVTELEKCEEPTPANIVESLFKFILNQTPCASDPESAHSTDLKTANGVSQQTAAFVTTIALGISIYLI